MDSPEILQDTAQSSSKSKSQSPNEDGADPPPRKPGSKAQGRKRTKTGCLTCRKRRIKCGEERPTCQNCTKSKRHCEGYNQRVVFKDPLNIHRSSFATSSHAAFSRQSIDQLGVRHGEVYPQPASGQFPLPLAPKLQGAFGPSKAVGMPPLPAATSPGSERRVYNFSDIKGPAAGNKSPQPRSSPPFDIQTDTIDLSHVPDPRPQHSPRDQAAHYDFNALVKQENREDPPITPAQTSPLDWSVGPSSGFPSHPQELFHHSNRQFAAALPFYQTYPTTSTWESVTTAASVGQSLPAPDQHEIHPKARADGPQTPSEGRDRDLEHFHPSWREHQQKIHDYPPLATTGTTTQSDLSQEDPSSAMVEDEDDPFDVSDEDTAMEQQEESSGAWQEDIQDSHLKHNDLGILVALQVRQDNQDLSLRSFTSFIDGPDMLATYMPTPQSTPLRDQITARIFYHFVNVTGPCISLFERHPANPSLVFQGVPVPKSQQNIWAYTFPTLALQNPALLHSMLALGSLHIAKLQNGPIAASLKHYAIGLRRVAKSVSIHSRRKQPATLAAAMLLAFYECWSADHQKWSNHILGAKQLVKEIDFAGMTRYIKTRKGKQRQEDHLRYQQAHAPGGGYELDDRARFQPNVDEVDENIVSMLMGKKLFYDRYGQIIDDNDSGDPIKEYSERDLETYETQRDLFWWYCKQDVYQSILGGGRLFMEYSLWSHCPPRSPLGQLTATFGTFDHLMLLMGRLADFAAKDLKRKRMAIKANGGHWRPPQEYMNMQAQAAQASGSQAFPQTPPKQPQMPAFSGMLPGVQKAQLPMGFEASREDSPRSTQSEEMDLQARTQEAEEEWQEIRNAFDVLEDYFGEDFQALGPEFAESMETPFGPALKYRTYAIAGIWMNFYMGLIACHRSHPSMPPAAMMAAGIAARQTASFANELGRIAAGIFPECSSTTQVNPNVGAALIESSTCLFISGVQYQDAAQRAWTVRRLRDIGRLTGWQTAYAIAAGCETSWTKTAGLGKGPPYNKTFEENLVPDLWISSRRIDRALVGLSAEDRRLTIEQSERVHYALGVLSTQEDFENLDLDGDETQPPPPM